MVNLSTPPSGPRVKYDLDIASIVQAICSVKQVDWSTFFEIIRQQQYQQLRGAQTDADRSRIQHSVKAVDVIEDQFNNIRINKKFSA